MLTKVQPQPPAQLQAVNGLASLVRAWQDATVGASLLEVEAPVGLLLFDVAMALNLNANEQRLVFGPNLRRELLRGVDAHNGKEQ